MFSLQDHDFQGSGEQRGRDEIHAGFPLRKTTTHTHTQIPRYFSRTSLLKTCTDLVEKKTEDMASLTGNPQKTVVGG